MQLNSQTFTGSGLRLLYRKVRGKVLTQLFNCSTLILMSARLRDLQDALTKTINIYWLTLLFASLDRLLCRYHAAAQS